MEAVRRATYLGQDGCGIMVVWAEERAQGIITFLCLLLCMVEILHNKSAFK